MRFILKLFTLGFVGLLILPAFVPDSVRLETQPVAAMNDSGEAYADGQSVLAFASGVAADMQGLCYRQPAVCVHGARLIDGLVSRAEHGLRAAFAMIERRRDADSGQMEEAPAQPANQPV